MGTEKRHRVGEDDPTCIRRGDSIEDVGSAALTSSDPTAGCCSGSERLRPAMAALLGHRDPGYR